MLHRMSTILNEEIRFNIACIRNFNNISNLSIQYCLATLFLQSSTLSITVGSPRVELHCCAEMDGWLGSITWKAFACVYCNAVDCMQCNVVDRLQHPRSVSANGSFTHEPPPPPLQSMSDVRPAWNWYQFRVSIDHHYHHHQHPTRARLECLHRK